MIYVCLPSHDEAETLGLVLWKTRKVFEALGREYHIVVADDASGDHTADVLEKYGRVVPLTMIRHPQRQGYARTVEALLRQTLDLSDRPRRDCAILMHADYVHLPDALADLVRKIDSGADLVVGDGRLHGVTARGYRLARRFGAFWLRPALRIPGARDPLSGFVGIRLATLRPVLEGPGPIFSGEGWVATAELVARAAASARQIETVVVDERHDLRTRPSRIEPWTAARAMFGARRRIRLARGAERPPVPVADAAPSHPRRRRGRSRRAGS